MKQIKNKKYFCAVVEQGSTIQKDEQWFDKDGNSIEHKQTEELSSDVAIAAEEYVVLWSKSQYKGKNIIQTEYLKGQNAGIETYLYSDYDDKGNWIKRIISHDGKPIYIEEREIKYTE